MIQQFSPKIGMIPDAPPGVDINPSQTGYTAEALARLSGSLEKGVTDLYDKQKKAEDNQYESDSKIDFFTQVEQYKLDRKKLGYENYAADVNKFTQKLFDQQQKDAPSDTAREGYESAVGLKRASYNAEAASDEFVMRAESYMRSGKDNADKAQSFLLLNPDQKKAAFLQNELLQKLDKDVQTGVYTPEAAAKLRDYTKNSVSTGLVDGLFKSQRYVEGLKLLRSAPTDQTLKAAEVEAARSVGLTDQVPPSRRPQGASSQPGASNLQTNPLTEGLTPDQQSSWLGKFQDKLKEKTHEKISDFRRQFSDLEAALGAGATSDINPAILQTLGDLKGRKTITPGEYDALAGKLYTAQAQGRAIQRLVGAPESEMVKIIQAPGEALKQYQMGATSAEAKSPTFNFVDKAQAEAKVIATAQHIAKLRREDAPGFIDQNAKYFPEVSNLKAQAMSQNARPDQVQAYAKKVDQLQEYWQIPEEKQRIVSKEDSWRLAQSIDTGDANSSAEQLTKIQTQYGEYFPRVMDDMIADNKLLQGYRLAAVTPIQGDRSRMISNVRDQGDINKAFKDNPKVNERILNSHVESQLRDFRMAMSLSGSKDEMMNGIRDNVMTEAKRMQNRGVDPETAAKNASLLVKNTYQVVKADNSVVAMPKQIGGQEMNPAFVEAFIKSHSDPAVVHEMGGVAPGSDKLNPMMSQARQKERFDTYIQGSGRWVTNGDQTGMTYQYSDKDGVTQYVLDRNNRPLSVKYADVVRSPDKRTTEELQGVFGRMKERVFGK